MNQSTDILEKLKTLLGMQVTLEEIELANGTILEAEEFTKGNEVFIKNEDEEKVPLPEGLYDLAEGKKLVVIDEGIIDEIKEINQKEENSMEDQTLSTEQVLEENEDKKEEMQYAKKEDVDRLEKDVKEIKMMVEKMMDQKEEKKEMAKVTEEVEELKEELSKPAATAIKHSPESKPAVKQVLHSQNRSLTTLDRVMARISKINN
tara:strand:- start:794 stop:1408 length:615 start_codon:yes stop_codon:yes gene_type:complete